MNRPFNIWGAFKNYAQIKTPTFKIPTYDATIRF